MSVSGLGVDVVCCGMGSAVCCGVRLSLIFVLRCGYEVLGRWIGVVLLCSGVLLAWIQCVMACVKRGSAVL